MPSPDTLDPSGREFNPMEPRAVSAPLTRDQAASAIHKIIAQQAAVKEKAAERS